MKKEPFFFSERNAVATACGIALEVLCILLYVISETRDNALHDGLAYWWFMHGTDLVLLAALVPFFAAVIASRRARKPPDARLVLFFAALLGITLLMTTGPLKADDVYGYVFYGRAFPFHGLDPYAVVPNDVSSDVAIPFVARMWLRWKNPYGPLWSLIAMVPAVLGGGSIARATFMFDVLAAEFFIGAAWVLHRLAKEIGGPRFATTALLAFAWNPVLLFEFVQNAHNDGAMLFFLLLALLLLGRKKYAGAGAALAASCMVKYVSAVVAPMFALYLLSDASGMRSSRERMAALVRFAVAAAAFSAACYLPFLASGAVFDGLRNQAHIFAFGLAGLIPVAVSFFTLHPLNAMTNQLVAPAVAAPTAIIAVAAYAALLFAARRRMRSLADLCVGAALALGVAIMSVSWVMSWYFAWLVPLLIVAGRFEDMLALSIAAVAAYSLPVSGIELLLMAWFGGRELQRRVRVR